MDTEKIRNDFSYLDAKKVGKDVIYLDTAATSQKPNRVIEAVDSYYKYKNANPHRGAHYLSWVATEAYENGRDVIKKFINAGSRLSLIHISEPTRRHHVSRMPSSA